MDIAGHTILTITQVTSKVKFTLERDYANLWIQGEIASCKPYPSGHIYLTLKDAQSELSSVIFSQYTHQLSHQPKIGMKVTVNGDLSLYSPRGQFQLQIKSLYPSGQGELWLAYEALKQKLEAEGLFDKEKKKRIPRFPKRIGIITSSEGAALKDMIQVLNRRAPHVACVIYPVPVQGKQAALKISSAISAMNQYGGMDTLIVGRGGGSLEDLWCFNDENVVRAIYASRIPLISAVGHETDTTLSDYAADCRAPTPSAAAELAAEDRHETIQLLDNYTDKLNTSIHQIIHRYWEKVNSYQKRHGFFKPQLIFQRCNNKLNDTNNRLTHTALNYIKTKVNDVKSKNDKIKLLNPNTQLKRGFAIVTDAEQKIVYSSTQVDVDDVVKLKLAEGVVTTKVLKGEKGHG